MISDSQLRAHASELRHRWLFPRCRSCALGGSHVYVLPVGVERSRYPVALDPAPQHSCRRPGRFLFRGPAQRRAGRIVHHVHQTTPLPSLLQPLMKASVQLHQLAKVRLALPPPPIRFSPPLSPPQPGLLHPPAQRLRLHCQSVIASQVLARQRRPKILIAGFHLLQHGRAKLPRMARFETRPQLPCCSAGAPPARYRAQIRLPCR